MDKPTPQAKALIKALSIHTDNELDYKFAGWQLAYILDSVQRNRYILVWDGYNEVRKHHGF